MGELRTRDKKPLLNRGRGQLTMQETGYESRANEDQTGNTGATDWRVGSQPPAAVPGSVQSSP